MRGVEALLEVKQKMTWFMTGRSAPPTNTYHHDQQYSKSFTHPTTAEQLLETGLLPMQ